jgi:rhamnopyranosyl-N-acetylglucosaminyl-diphospho-decaprenol beta-1,3/1,4-galactofuranosyltransferase
VGIRDCTVFCVVVTRDRPELLRRAIAAIAAQSRRPDHLIVVDNGSDPVVHAICASSGIPLTYLPASTNLGGAGGFAYGVLTARALGADWVWLADDDGRPADRWTLARLLVCADENQLAAVSPAVVDEKDPNQLAFPLRRGLRWIRRRSDLQADVLVEGVANLFNGALFSAGALDAIGVPDPRLFVRGDEVEIHRRLRRSGLRFGTCTASMYLHPQGRDDWAPLLGGRLMVLVPRDPARRALTYRNLGYLTAQPGLRWRRWPDAARYAWYYLVQQRDPAGFADWRQYTRDGRRERFGRSPAGCAEAVGASQAG